MDNVTELQKRPRKARSLGEGLPKNTLAPLNPISRDELETALSYLGSVATLIGKNVVHNEALTAFAHLEEVEAVFLGMLPGGERFARCEGCGVLLGPDDQMVTDSEFNHLCPRCAEGLHEKCFQPE